MIALGGWVSANYAAVDGLGAAYIPLYRSAPDPDVRKAPARIPE